MKTRATLSEVYGIILQRLEVDPESSYVASLMEKGEDAILRKIGEESLELILAAKNGVRKEALHELVDVWFHLLVWMAKVELTPDQVELELGRRFGRSGLDEKWKRTME